MPPRENETDFLARDDDASEGDPNEESLEADTLAGAEARFSSGRRDLSDGIINAEALNDSEVEHIEEQQISTSALLESLSLDIVRPLFRLTSTSTILWVTSLANSKRKPLKTSTKDSSPTCNGNRNDEKNGSDEGGDAKNGFQVGDHVYQWRKFLGVCSYQHHGIVVDVEDCNEGDDDDEQELGQI